MNTATQEANKQFYERLTANLYSADYENFGSSVFRANSFKEAISKAVSTIDKLIGVNKLDFGEDQIHELYEAIGLIELQIIFDDQNDLERHILHGGGDYRFILEQRHEDYLRQISSMDALIELLEKINEAWHLRCSSIELFLEEYKEFRKDEGEVKS